MVDDPRNIETKIKMEEITYQIAHIMMDILSMSLQKLEEESLLCVLSDNGASEASFFVMFTTASSTNCALFERIGSLSFRLSEESLPVAI